MKPPTKFKQTEIGMIPEDWGVKLLGEVASYITEKTKVSDFNLNNFVSTENLLPDKSGVITASSLPRTGKVTIFRVNDLLFSNIRTYFKKLWLARFKGGCSNDVLVIRSKDSALNQFFLYYFLSQESFFEYTTLTSKGTKMPRGDKKAIMDFKINIPSLQEQGAIAKILSDLDAKIELNRQTNSTLEQTGQALFKRWFVDFEFPDENGKPYRSSGGKMVDSELGEIPKGWKVGTLGDICEITMGQSPPGETYNETEDGLPFYQGVRDFGFRFPTQRVYCTEPTRFAEEGDVLLSVRAPVGSLNIAEKKCAIGRGVAALRLKAKQQEYLYYLLLTTRTDWNKFEAEGTVFGSASKTDVHEFKVILPPERLRDRFGSVLEPFDKQITTNEKQFRNLAAIRDALLPKLMSGEIRVSANA